MKKIKMIIAVISVVSLLITATTFASDKPEVKKLNSKNELAEYVRNNKVNIVLCNEKNQIIEEYHTDGLVADYIYDNSGNVLRSTDNKGGEQVLEYDGDNIITRCYQSGRYIKERILGKVSSDFEKLTAEQKKSLAEKKIKNYTTNNVSRYNSSLSFRPLSTTSYEDYYVKGYLMNDIACSAPNRSEKYIMNSSNGLTQNEIQALFVSKNSILQNNIEYWVLNEYGQPYKTPAMISPASCVYSAQQSSNVNAKVILATMQKESSLVSGINPGGITYSDSRFLWAMGYGKTDGATYNSCAGFANQVSGGANLLYSLWLNSPSSGYPIKMTVNDGATKSDNSGNTYKGYIWVKNYGTYALYKYTPWTIDTKYLPSTVSGGNYLFAVAFNNYWGTNWD